MGVSARGDRMNERNKRASRYAYLVLGTAHNCPVLPTGVGCQKDVPENRNSLKRGVFFSFTFFASHKTTAIFCFSFICTWERKSNRYIWNRRR